MEDIQNLSLGLEILRAYFPKASMEIDRSYPLLRVYTPYLINEDARARLIDLGWEENALSYYWTFEVGY